MRFWFAVVALLGLAAPARADAVTDQINEAQAAYSRHDFTTAIAALDAAKALLQTAATEIWKNYLPPAPAGWSVAATEAGSGTLGIGSDASRRYVQNADTVDIQLMTDSPIMQGLADILANPMIIAATGHNVVVDGRRMSYMRADNSLVTLVGGRVLVRVRGSSGVSEAVLRQFIGLLAFADIEQAIRQSGR